MKHEHFCYRCQQFKPVSNYLAPDAPCPDCQEARELAQKALQQDAIREQQAQRGLRS